jgi:NAD dependent epimerase/dehydratase
MNIDEKNILVTGADGFIGSHLVEFLLKNTTAKVTALCLYNSLNNWGWLEDVAKSDHLKIVTGDIRDPFLCDKIVESQDVIFNLAALIAIPYSYIAPQSYVETNVTGTLNLCQAALKHKVSCFVQTSTSEVYGSARYVPIDEKHPLQPQSPYSASKIGSDAMAMSHFFSFNLPVIVARPFNTYGPRQSARAVIPTIIAQLASGKKEIDLGDTSPTRDFNYVEDTCRGLVALAQAPSCIGEVVNIGSNFEISIGDLFGKIKAILNADGTIRHDPQRVRPANSEVQRLWCDNSKISQLTGFKPQVSIDQGLTFTAKWFRDPENLKKYKVDIYNV